MSTTTRSVIKWSFRVAGAVTLVLAMWMAVAAFPQPLFPYKQKFGSCIVYSDEAFDGDFADVMTSVNMRLDALELHGPDKHPRVFVCHSPKLFAFYARLSFVNPAVQGYNISLFGNSFVSLPRIFAFRLATGGFPPYGAREGSIAHIIAHEILHEYGVDEIGFITYNRLPRWKREGYSEYGATIAAVRRDNSLGLPERLAILQNDANWRSGTDWFREHYRWALMVEYLSDIRGYRFADIVHDTVTYDDTYAALLAWAESRAAGRPR